MDAKFLFFFNLSFIAPRIDAGNKWNVYEAFIDCVFRESVLPLQQGTLVASNYKNMSKFINQRNICQSYRNQSVDLKCKSIEWFTGTLAVTETAFCRYSSK